MIIFPIYWVISILTGVVLGKKFFVHLPILAGGSIFLYFWPFFDILLTFSGRLIYLPRVVLIYFLDFLAVLGIFLGVNLRNGPNFNFQAFSRGLKMSKISKIPIFRHSSTFSGRPVWLPKALLLYIFDFLVSLGIFLGVNFRNRPNFHFQALSKGSKMSKISKIPIF